MTRFHLALIGCWRRPLRSGLTAGGVAVAIATAFSLLSFQHGYQQGLQRELNRLGAHILIAPKGCPYEATSLALHGANWPCYLKMSYLREIGAVEGILAAAPVLMSAAYEADARQVVYLGIDSNMLTLKPGWKLAGRFPKENEVMLGAEIARERNWGLGDSILLPGLPKFRASVAGILNATQSAEDRFIYLPLAEAQKKLGHPEELTHVLVRLSEPNRMEAVTKALRGCDAGLQMNIVPLAHVFRSIQSLLLVTHWFLGCATAAAILAAAAGVTATLLIAVSERAREIGVLRALGASRGDVASVLWLESLQICVAGAFIGMLISFASVRLVEDWLRVRLPFVPGGRLVVWEWWIVGACLLLAIFVGSVAVLLPAWRAAQLMPFEAMRRKCVYV